MYNSLKVENGKKWRYEVKSIPSWNVTDKQRKNIDGIYFKD